jgi:hypothetical protein
MLKFIKKYYVATFAGFFVGTLVKELLSKSNNTLPKSLLIAFVTGLVISLIAGTLYYFQDTKWGPKKRNKLFTKRPFSDLLMNRFIQKDDAVVGIINGYTVTVAYTWPNGHSAIAVNVLFDKDFTALYKGSIADIKERNKPKKGLFPENYLWNEASIGYLIPYNFGAPSYDKVLSTAEMMIEVLRAERLPAVGYEDKNKPKLAAGESTRFGVAG